MPDVQLPKIKKDAVAWLPLVLVVSKTDVLAKDPKYARGPIEKLVFNPPALLNVMELKSCAGIPAKRPVAAFAPRWVRSPIVKLDAVRILLVLAEGTPPSMTANVPIGPAHAEVEPKAIRNAARTGKKALLIITILLLQIQSFTSARVPSTIQGPNLRTGRCLEQAWQGRTPER